MENVNRYFTLRLNRIHILDNREWGTAEVKILSFVTCRNQSLPMLDNYIATNDNDEKRAIIKATAEGIIASRELIEIQNVKDNTILTFGEAGYALYRTSEIPAHLDWTLVVIERDEDVRAIGEMLTNFVNSQEFEGFTNEIINRIAGEQNPAAKIVFGISKFIAGKVGQSLASNRDDQIGLYIESLNKFEHYPHLKRDRNDQRGVNGNIYVDYTIFGVDNPISGQ